MAASVSEWTYGIPLAHARGYKNNGLPASGSPTKVQISGMFGINRAGRPATQYFTFIRNNPCAGAVVTAAVRCRDSRIVRTRSGVSFPSPTAASAPTMLRTIL